MRREYLCKSVYDVHFLKTHISHDLFDCQGKAVRKFGDRSAWMDIFGRVKAGRKLGHGDTMGALIMRNYKIRKSN